MPLVNGSFPALINGVSQQPPALRLPSQGELQDNAEASLTDGLGKRSPTNHILRLQDFDNPNPLPFVHFIHRDENEQYVVIIESGVVRIWNITPDPDGLFKAIPVKSQTHFDKDYLICDRPAEAIRALTLADTTFIVNTERKVGMNPKVTQDRTREALIWVKQAEYNATYTLSVEDVSVSFTTNEDPNHGGNTSYIARELLADLVTKLDPDSKDWEFDRYGNVIWVRRRIKDGATQPDDFNVSVTDTRGNTLLTSIKGSVQRFSDLPPVGYDGITVKVFGSVTENSDDYYVWFDREAATEGMGKGVWKETTKPGIEYQFDDRSMPRILTRQQDTDGSIYFSFTPAPWAPREVGDEVTAKNPSFVGSTISSMFLFRNRLGFLTGSKIVLSGAGDLYNFWRETVLDVLDSDPIDVEAAHPRAINLKYAMPYNGDLLVFGEAAQFIFTGGDILSSKTAAMKLVSEYEIDLGCVPKVAGSSVFFPFINAKHSGVREYFVDANSQYNANTITLHVPKYINGRTFRISTCTTDNRLVALADTDRNVAYVYKWHYNGQEKLQSAWYRYVFPDDTMILAAEFIGSHLYLVQGREVCGVFLERLDINTLEDTDANYVTLLDRRMPDTAIDSSLVKYDAKTNTTTIELPYKADGEVMVISRATSNPAQKPGVVYSVVELTTVGCDGHPDTTLYRQAFRCDDGTTANVWIPAALGFLIFKFDGECYNTNELSTVAHEPGRVADHMTTFTNCAECITGHGLNYRQARSCLGGVLVDVWIPADLGELTFEFNGVCYHTVMGDPESFTPGTIATAITLAADCDSCVPPPPPPGEQLYMQARNCSDDGVATLWVPCELKGIYFEYFGVRYYTVTDVGEYCDVRSRIESLGGMTVLDAVDEITDGSDCGSSPPPPPTLVPISDCTDGETTCTPSFVLAGWSHSEGTNDYSHFNGTYAATFSGSSWTHRINGTGPDNHDVELQLFCSGGGSLWQASIQEFNTSDGSFGSPEFTWAANFQKDMGGGFCPEGEFIMTAWYGVDPSLADSGAGTLGITNS
jgi:hypothetical protein